jgi:hypothetical protein
VKKLIILFLIFNLLGCLTVLTKIKPNEENKDCELITKELELDSAGRMLSGYSGSTGINGEGALAILAVELTYTAFSAVFAGSVYMAGNVIHWMEKSAFCDKKTSMLKEEIEEDASNFV